MAKARVGYALGYGKFTNVREMADVMKQAEERGLLMPDHERLRASDLGWRFPPSPPTAIRAGAIHPEVAANLACWDSKHSAPYSPRGRPDRKSVCRERV